jgi:hypothetical protein
MYCINLRAGSFRVCTWFLNNFVILLIVYRSSQETAFLMFTLKFDCSHVSILLLATELVRGQCVWTSRLDSILFKTILLLWFLFSFTQLSIPKSFCCLDEGLTQLSICCCHKHGTNNCQYHFIYQFDENRQYDYAKWIVFVSWH